MKPAPDAELLARFTAPLPSMAERMAQGKALREQVPYERHAEYRPTERRQDPVAECRRSVGPLPLQADSVDIQSYNM